MKIPNWFDVVVLLVLLFGLQRGRKRGMSEEVLTMLRWVGLVVVCGVFYERFGSRIASRSSVFDHLQGYLIAYVGLALGVAIVFSIIKRILGGKLVGSDAFGRGEYYLGMLAGVIRFACIIIAVLALLNARYYRPEEIKAMDLYQKDVYGSDFFPTLSTVQRQVFQDSFIGPYIKTNLSFLLIRPTIPEHKELHHRDVPMP